MSEGHMQQDSHLEDAKKLYRKAVEEFEIAREKSDRIFLCDACAKGWLFDEVLIRLDDLKYFIDRVEELEEAGDEKELHEPGIKDSFIHRPGPSEDAIAILFGEIDVHFICHYNCYKSLGGE